MRTIPFGHAECQGLPVDYEILAEEMDGLERYGLRVRYQDETAEVLNISMSQRGIQALAEALVVGSVTPTTLRDVVDDWLY